MSEDGSEDHETLPSVDLLLLEETFIKFPGNPWLATSPDNFFSTDLRPVELSISTKSLLAESFFTDAVALLSSMDDFEDIALFFSLDGNLLLVDFLGAYTVREIS